MNAPDTTQKSGKIILVGFGPGAQEHMSYRARAAIANAARDRDYLTHALAELNDFAAQPGEEEQLATARTEWLRARGIGQRALAAERGLLFAIAGLEIRFLSPARLDDELLATCALTRRGGASMEFRQQIIRVADNAVLADARVRAACLDAASFRPRPLPEDLVFGGISDTKTEKKPASR